MNILSEAYYKTFAENEKNIRFWENYLQNLKSLDFSTYSDKLKVPALVPIGSRILFRGELKHTNELTVALGADYFVKCSAKQAEVLRQHRIKGAQSKLATFIKEKDYLDNQFTFAKKNVFEREGQEIIEYHTEEEDKLWREKHRENVKMYKQNKGKEEETPKEEITDEELWNRLEELELQEELENEYLDMKGDSENNTEESFIVKEDYIKVSKEKTNSERREKDDLKNERNKNVMFKEIKPPEETPKMDLLLQVIDRQNELESKLIELKNRERSQSKTEQDLISKLDEMDQLDELEDEMDRLDDIIENEDTDQGEEETNKSQTTKFQRRVSFIDEDDSETLELTFKHSSTEPNNEPYTPEKGIQKPCDVYQAYSNFFGNETTSILKKSKYEATDAVSEREEMKHIVSEYKTKKTVQVNKCDTEEIVIKDVVEKVHENDKSVESKARPTSLFKKRRMQSKS